MGAKSVRPFRGLSGGATRATASRRTLGPLWELRGDPGTQTRLRQDGHRFRPTRTAFRRPPGTRGAGPPEPACAGRGPPFRFHSPSEVHRSTPAPSRGSEDPHVGRCFLSWALLPYDTCGTTDPHFARLPTSLRAASGVWVPPSRRPPSPLPTPCGAGASMGFTLQGLLLATIGTPSGAPCPPGVLRVDSPHPHGERADAAAFRASIPSRARSAIPSPEGPGAPMPSWVSSLQSVHSPRPSPPLRFAGDPSTRVGRFDVPSRLRLEVFRLEEIGFPLSGMPALLGFITFRPSRHRGDRGGGRAHAFASRLVRVASGANRSKPPHITDPATAFAAARYRRPSVNGCLPLPIVRACFQRTQPLLQQPCRCAPVAREDRAAFAISLRANELRDEVFFACAPLHKAAAPRFGCAVPDPDRGYRGGIDATRCPHTAPRARVRRSHDGQPDSHRSDAPLPDLSTNEGEEEGGERGRSARADEGRVNRDRGRRRHPGDRTRRNLPSAARNFGACCRASAG